VLKESQATQYSVVPTMNSMKSKVMIYLSLNIFCALQMEKKIYQAYILIQYRVKRTIIDVIIIIKKINYRFKFYIIYKHK
jgi:hypothetical protein